MNRRQLICLVAATAVAANAGPAWASQIKMTVYKDPNCGCCHAWTRAMKNAGFAVEVEDVENLDAVKKRFAVPTEMRGCHTAIVEGYFVEGHVPLEAVNKLLIDRPQIAGLAVPGMPGGSLGMGDDPNASYDVYSVGKDGVFSVTLQVRPRA